LAVAKMQRPSPPREGEGRLTAHAEFVICDHTIEATFADALAAVRHHLWTSRNYDASTPTPELELLPRDLWQRLYDAACYAA